MKLIIYKKRSKFYECMGIKDDGGDDVAIIFDEPISGSIAIKDKALPLVRGVCKTSVGELCEGECAPTLFTGGKRYKLERFFVKDGIVQRRSPDEDYIRELYENYLSLENRILKIEAVLEEINDKITQKIKF